VETALTARDELDRSRTASPLYAAADAIIIDTTGRSVDDVVARVLEVVATRM
jgi:cytidylate kinase